MASTPHIEAMASIPEAMASTPEAMASTLVAMASSHIDGLHLEAMASTLNP